MSSVHKHKFPFSVSDQYSTFSERFNSWKIKALINIPTMLFTKDVVGRNNVIKGRKLTIVMNIVMIGLLRNLNFFRSSVCELNIDNPEDSFLNKLSPCVTTHSIDSCCSFSSTAKSTYEKRENFHFWYNKVLDLNIQRLF